MPILSNIILTLPVPFRIIFTLKEKAKKLFSRYLNNFLPEILYNCCGPGILAISTLVGLIFSLIYFNLSFLYLIILFFYGLQPLGN
jgi:hypothetical protein